MGHHWIVHCVKHQKRMEDKNKRMFDALLFGQSCLKLTRVVDGWWFCTFLQWPLLSQLFLNFNSNIFCCWHESLIDCPVAVWIIISQATPTKKQHWFNNDQFNLYFSLSLTLESETVCLHRLQTALTRFLSPLIILWLFCSHLNVIRFVGTALANFWNHH